MVPHLLVEEKLHELAGLTERAFAVSSVPDGKKGERLVVLHTLAEDQLKACLQKLSEADLPNLWKPRPNQFFHIDSLPYLGTGKLPRRLLRARARSRTGPAGGLMTVFRAPNLAAFWV